MCTKLCSAVSQTNLGKILMGVKDPQEYKDLYQHYLHDFVHSVHKSNHKKEESRKQEREVCQ